MDAGTETDAALVRRARAGDDLAFRQLVHLHQRRAHALAWSLVGDPAEAEDLTQEAFLRAFRNLDLLADESKFAPWLHRIVFGTCVDWLRSFRPGLFQSAAATDDAFLNARAPDVIERELEHAELVERVTRALAALPPRYRTPLRLYHLDGLSHERVAEALGVPVPTVRSLVHRARRKLAALLADDRVMSEERPATGGWHLSNIFETPADQNSMLHVINGDSTRGSLELSNVPGRFTVWGDVLYEGPVPRDVPNDVFAEARARFHASESMSYEDALAMHRRWDAGLESSRDADEVVLWFEHDLHDQLLLARLLDWFARRTPRVKVLSLICIGEFPTVEPFHGLGQLTPDQLASLLDTRQRVTERQLALGQSTWRAFTGDDPTAIERIITRDTSALPFLVGALHRLLEDFPDARTGLPRTERTILEILTSRGPLAFGKLFPAQQKTEERVFMGDSTFWGRLEDLQRGPRPLVHIDREGNTRDLGARVAATDDGRRVLAGDLDWMAIAPFERWIGGTHLVAPNVSWRWDPSAQRLERKTA